MPRNLIALSRQLVRYGRHGGHVSEAGAAREDSERLTLLLGLLFLGLLILVVVVEAGRM